jgi:outer membrane protein
MYRVCILLIGLFLLSKAHAQHYSLQQCIDTAVANNFTVKETGLKSEVAQVGLHQARAYLLPNLYATINQGMNFGRGLDVATNTYVNQSINSGLYDLNSGVTLFSGSALQNRIRQAAFAYEAARMDVQYEKDNLVLNVILDYLLVLNNEDQLAVAVRQADYSQKQLDRLQVLDKQGAIKPSDVSDMKGQLMNDQVSIINAQNALESSKMDLALLMNVPYSRSMQLERVNIGELMGEYNGSPEEIFQRSVGQFSLVKAAELRTRSNQYAWKAARGLLWPTLTLGGRLSTSYANIGQSSTTKSYGQQLKDNKFSALGLGLTVPIFYGSIARNRVKLADIDYRNSQLVEQSTKAQLRKNIDQAYLNMSSARDRFTTLTEQVKAYDESFKAAEVRYNAGVGNSIDYLLAKDRLDRANISLVNAKYDFVLRKKVLDYYQNEGR